MNKALIFSILLIIISGCAKQETVTIITENDASIHFKLADSVANSLVKQLGGRLTDAIQNSGVIEAIDVCHKDAYKITDDLVDETEMVTSIKRVSNKYRNPKNSPDKYEVDALTWFENKISNDDVFPKSYGQRITVGKKEQLYIYKPMKMQNKCLLCHGDNKTRLPEVSKRIKKLYPDDRAIDYYNGDFRGLIRVELKL